MELSGTRERNPKTEVFGEERRRVFRGLDPFSLLCLNWREMGEPRKSNTETKCSEGKRKRGGGVRYTS